MMEYVDCEKVLVNLDGVTDLEIYIGENFLSAYSYTLGRHLQQYEIFKVLKEAGLCHILPKF